MKGRKISGRYRHFVTGLFKSHAIHMSDEDYAKVLDSIVPACVDIIVLNNGKILLGKRSREPYPGWWIIGGRMRPGESFEKAAAHNIKRELGLEIDLLRFCYLNTYSTVCAKRTQAPQGNGSHTVSITTVVSISNEEVKKITPNDEYEKLQWLKPHSISLNDSFHSLVRQWAEDLISSKHYKIE